MPDSPPPWSKRLSAAHVRTWRPPSDIFVALMSGSLAKKDPVSVSKIGQFFRVLALGSHNFPGFSVGGQAATKVGSRTARQRGCVGSYPTLLPVQFCHCQKVVVTK